LRVHDKAHVVLAFLKYAFIKQEPFLLFSSNHTICADSNFLTLLPVVMSEDMVSDGYAEIVNIDISSVVIKMMKKKYFEIPQLQCILDCLSLPFLFKDAIIGYCYPYDFQTCAWMLET
jgi:hypothetical protein